MDRKMGDDFFEEENELRTTSSQLVRKSGLSTLAKNQKVFGKSSAFSNSFAAVSKISKTFAVVNAVTAPLSKFATNSKLSEVARVASKASERFSGANKMGVLFSELSASKGVAVAVNKKLLQRLSGKHVLAQTLSRNMSGGGIGNHVVLDACYSVLNVGHPVAEPGDHVLPIPTIPPQEGSGMGSLLASSSELDSSGVLMDFGCSSISADAANVKKAGALYLGGHAGQDVSVEKRYYYALNNFIYYLSQNKYLEKAKFKKWLEKKIRKQIRLLVAFIASILHQTNFHYSYQPQFYIKHMYLDLKTSIKDVKGFAFFDRIPFVKNLNVFKNEKFHFQCT